jgi:catalase
MTVAPNSGPRPPLSPGAALGWMAAIGGVLVVAVAGFAYAGGWLGPDRLTPGRMVAALSNRGGDPLGHRRNHSKGVCFTGIFEANGAGAPFSTAPMLRKGGYPVIGRFAIAVGNPEASDLMGRVESMAVRITAPDGEEWRSGMNNSPVFVVPTPADFYTLTKTQEINPKTGKPDPVATAQFFATHPKSQPFAHWAKTAPWSGSWVDETYNSLDGADHTLCSRATCETRQGRTQLPDGGSGQAHRPEAAHLAPGGDTRRARGSIQ